jgi:CheY-like chemotaxis protein
MRMMLNTINSDSADLQAELGIPALNLSVELTGTGEVAWDLMRAKRFDIALIDLNLPGVSGQDLSWCVKQGSVEAHDDEQLSTSHKVASHETILIACTADDKEHSAALAAYGLHDLLYKPVSVMDLRHVLHKWLPRTGVSAVQQLPQLEQPASLQRNRSGVFAGRVLLVDRGGIAEGTSSQSSSILRTHYSVRENVELARRVRLSPSPCLARVRALEAAGTIRRYVALVDPEALGLGVSVFISISLREQNTATLAEFERRMGLYVLAGGGLLVTLWGLWKLLG